MIDKWEKLTSELENIGGYALNICQRDGEFGRGIFSIDPFKKSKIFIPKKLMIKKNDIYLADNKLRIKKDANYKEEIRQFFNFYQDNFSWGGGGKETTENFEKGLSLLNPNLKVLIKKHFLVDIEERHKGNWSEVIKREFLNARGIKSENSYMIAPIWELINHKVKSLPFILNNQGISSPDYHPSNNELRFSYNNISPISRFFCYGFFSEESMVFSIPFSINMQDIGFEISCKGIGLTDDSMKIDRTDNKFIIDGLPIADANHPGLPYDYLNEIFRKIGCDTNIDKILQDLIESNISIREKIIKECLPSQNEVSNMLFKVMNYEIGLIRANN